HRHLRALARLSTRLLSLVLDVVVVTDSVADVVLELLEDPEQIFQIALREAAERLPEELHRLDLDAFGELVPLVGEPDEDDPPVALAPLTLHQALALHPVD